jgi:hypothetical protein
MIFPQSVYIVLLIILSGPAKTMIRIDNRITAPPRVERSISCVKKTRGHNHILSLFDPPAENLTTIPIDFNPGMCENEAGFLWMLFLSSAIKIGVNICEENMKTKRLVSLLFVIFVLEACAIPTIVTPAPTAITIGETRYYIPDRDIACTTDSSLQVQSGGFASQGGWYLIWENVPATNAYRIQVGTDLNCWVPAYSGQALTGAELTMTSLAGSVVIPSDTPVPPPVPTDTQTATLTATLTPTLEPTLTETATAGFTPAGLAFGVPQLSSKTFQYKYSCVPSTPEITFQITLNGMTTDYYVFMFFRTRNLATNTLSDWNNGVPMPYKGAGKYELTVTWNMVPKTDELYGESAEFRYQFVASIPHGDVVLRSPVYTDVTLSACK